MLKKIDIQQPDFLVRILKHQFMDIYLYIGLK